MSILLCIKNIHIEKLRWNGVFFGPDNVTHGCVTWMYEKCTSPKQRGHEWLLREIMFLKISNHHRNQGKVWLKTRTYLFYWLLTTGRLTDSTVIDNNSNIYSIATSIVAYPPFFSTSSTTLPKLTWLSSCDYQEETTAKQRFLHCELVMKSWWKEWTWCHQQILQNFGAMKTSTFRTFAGRLQR